MTNCSPSIIRSSQYIRKCFSLHQSPARRKGETMPVYKDENRGTWYVKCQYEDHTGHRKQKLKRGFTRQKDAKKWERVFLQKMQRSPSMSFSALCDMYLEDLLPRVRKSTYNTNKRDIENYARPWFDQKPVDQITAGDFRQFQNYLLQVKKKDGKPLASGTVYNIESHTRSVFRYAVLFHGLARSPCDGIKNSGKLAYRTDFWTVSDFQSVIGHVKAKDARVAITVLFYSGMRIGELMALTAGDIDLVNNTITITKSMNPGKEVTDPKTDNGTRVVTMPAAVMDQLRDYMQHYLYKPAPDHLLFFKTREAYSGQLKRAALAAGAPELTLHGLRHSHVSMLIELGFPAHLIADRIGDTVEMVIRVYGHLYPNKQKEVATRLQQLLQ